VSTSRILTRVALLSDVVGWKRVVVHHDRRVPNVQLHCRVGYGRVRRYARGRGHARPEEKQLFVRCQVPTRRKTKQLPTSSQA